MAGSKKKHPPKQIDGITYWFCTGCEKDKPEDSFYRRSFGLRDNPITARPVMYQCKECDNKRRAPKHRKAYFRKYSREWHARKRKEWSATQKCEKCSHASNLSVISLVRGVRSSQLSPWYGKKPPRDQYMVLCRDHASWEMSSMISSRIAELWGDGIYSSELFAGYEAYPYIPTQRDFDDMGMEMLAALHEKIPKGLPNEIRSDLGQNISLSILEGEYKLDDFDDIQLMKKFITQAWKEAPSKYLLSLDHPVYGDDGRTLLQTLEDKKSKKLR